MNAPLTNPPKPKCFGDYAVIDVDTHYTEPHDLWLSAAPAKYKDRVPQVKMYDGRMSWVIDGDKCIEHGASPHSVIRKDGSKDSNYGFLQWSIDDCHLGSWKLAERIEFMDAVGINAQIVYPNLLGFGGQKAAMVDGDLRLLCVQIYNDQMARLQAESNGRLYPMALLPWWDIAESANEARRTAAMGLRGVNINPDPYKKIGPDGRPLPDLNEEAWNPLWEACVELKLPINFHIGSSENVTDWFGEQSWPSLDRNHNGILGGAMLFFNNARVMGNLILGGVLDRFPELKFVSVESGIGWIPFLLATLDYQHDQVVDRPRLQRKPSEYFPTNFYGCFWFERKGIADLIRTVGVDNVLFETDFPHPTCLYPIDDVSEALGGLAPDEIRRVLSGNAAKLYNIAI